MGSFYYLVDLVEIDPLVLIAIFVSFGGAIATVAVAYGKLVGRVRTTETQLEESHDRTDRLNDSLDNLINYFVQEGMRSIGGKPKETKSDKKE